MPPRKSADSIKNLRLMNFLLEYFSAIDKMIYDKAVADNDPSRYITPDQKHFMDAMDEIERDIGKIVDGQKQGRDTARMEEKLLRRLISELDAYAKYAVSRTSAQEVAARVPQAQLFDGIQPHLRKFGGDKISALIALDERNRNFEASLDNPPPQLPPRPKTPLLPPPKPPKP